MNFKYCENILSLINMFSFNELHALVIAAVKSDDIYKSTLIMLMTAAVFSHMDEEDISYILTKMNDDSDS